MAQIFECLYFSFEHDSRAKTLLFDIQDVDKELEENKRAKDPINRIRKATGEHLKEKHISKTWADSEIGKLIDMLKSFCCLLLHRDEHAFPTSSNIIQHCWANMLSDVGFF